MFRRSTIAAFIMVMLLFTSGCATSRPATPPAPPALSKANTVKCPKAISGGYLVGFRTPAALQQFLAQNFLKFAVDGAQSESGPGPSFDRLTPTVLLLKDFPFDPRTTNNSEIEYVDDDTEVTLLRKPNDGDFAQQCGLKTINAPSAWDYAKPDHSKTHEVKVAIVDSGIARNKGLPYVYGDYDFYGHGSHLAGIIGAGDADGGTVGVVWNVKLYGYSFTDSSGRGTLGEAVKQLIQAVHDAPHIILLAWGSPCPSQTIVDQINDHEGILFVAAAGNERSDLNTTPIYPAVIDAPNLITVMATDCADSGGAEGPALFTSFGKGLIDIAAPGAAAISSAPCVDACGTSPHGILSTVLSDLYCCAKGTSMSAAFVAGAAALVKAYTSLTGSGLRTCLMESAHHLATLAGKCDCGRLDLRKAVDEAQRPPSCK